MRPPNAGKGRPLGSKNKRTVEFMQVLEDEGFDPAKALIQCYRAAKTTYDNYSVILEAITSAREAKNDQTGEFSAPTEDNAHKYLKIAADIAKDLASYAYPKLRSIEQTKANPLEGMSPQERLEVMKGAVVIAESEIKKADDGSGAL